MNYGKCPYCGSGVKLQNSTTIYSKDYGNIYVCGNYPNCDAYVGTHKGTNKPLGRLANKKLRELKKKAHLYFDSIWKYRKLKTKDKNSRKLAYKWLSEQLGIDVNDTHIGYFDEETTQKVINLCYAYYKKYEEV
jgi:hypothetical protein